jgi:hypothetical protein
MDNTEALNLFNKLIGVLSDTGYSEYAGVKLKKLNEELVEALGHIIKGESVWPDPDWEKIMRDAYERNPDDQSIPMEYLIKWNGEADENNVNPNGLPF